MSYCSLANSGSDIGPSNWAVGSSNNHSGHRTNADFLNFEGLKDVICCCKTLQSDTSAVSGIWANANVAVIVVKDEILS